ncbi:MAG TPA: peroxiredoxin-like family protein [Stellaceae bacterium]|nr:peroxiredoxin-like family protein [Stellaceae bacterium]
MSLRDQLDEQWRRTRERSPEIRTAYEALVADLGRSGVVERALKAGDRMPEFELPDVEGTLVSSVELLARGPLALSFFRGGWCPYCRLELKALQETLPEIEHQGATLAAITPDTGTAFAAIKRAHELGFEVLSDVDNGVGLTFGIIFRVPLAIKELYLRLGIDLGARHGNATGEWLLPVPATYIVDRHGVIRHAELDPDFKQRMEPKEIVRSLSGLSQS